jgi:SP family general alpha glucoside:H+ symporter-like MFS transporter
VAWAAQILSGSSFANQPTYFLQQAGFSTANSFNINLGAKGLAFLGTCGSWITLSASFILQVYKYSTCLR